MSITASRFAAGLLGLVVATVLPVCALAEKRVALVIGNSNYRHVSSLANPGNDARLMADTLKAVGFTLVGGGAQLDLDDTGLRRVVQTFGAQLARRRCRAVLLCRPRRPGARGELSGAGRRQSDERSRCRLPDARHQRGAAPDGERGHAALLVILDACRNNPFGGRGLRTTAPGLAQMQAPKGTLISFATQPGNVAADGTGSNSPFTTALAETIRKPGLGLFDAFNAVGLAVERATGGAQQPWVSSSPIAGTFYFAGLPVAPSVPRRRLRRADPDAAARRDYELALEIRTPGKLGMPSWRAIRSGYYTDLGRSCNGRSLRSSCRPLPPATPPGAEPQPAVGVVPSKRHASRRCRRSASARSSRRTPSRNATPARRWWWCRRARSPWARRRARRSAAPTKARSAG